MVQVGPGRSLGNPEHGANLGMLVPLNIVQHEHRPLPVLQLQQRTPKTILKLIRFSRITKRTRVSIDQFVGVTHLAPPSEVQRGIADDPVEPRPERLIGAEPTQRPMGMQESFLHGILGVFMRKQNRPRNGIGALLVAAHKLRKGTRVAFLRRQHILTLLLATGSQRLGSGLGVGNCGRDAPDGFTRHWDDRHGVVRQERQGGTRGHGNG